MQRIEMTSPARANPTMAGTRDRLDILDMKTPTSSFFRLVAVLVLALIAASFTLEAADSGWIGQYTDKKFLAGRAVFQLSIEQSGSAMQVSFDAAWADGHGAARSRRTGDRFRKHADFQV